MELLDSVDRASRGDPEARMMLLIALRALSLQRDALSVAKWVVETEKRLRMVGKADEISRAIIETLALRGPMNISELARALRELRGSASRRIIAKRLEELVDIGLVRLLGEGRGKVYAAKMDTNEQKK